MEWNNWKSGSCLGLRWPVLDRVVIGWGGSRATGAWEEFETCNGKDAVLADESIGTSCDLVRGMEGNGWCGAEECDDWFAGCDGWSAIGARGKGSDSEEANGGRDAAEEVRSVGTTIWSWEIKGDTGKRKEELAAKDNLGGKSDVAWSLAGKEFSSNTIWQDK